MVDLENNNLNISLLAEENISSALINENLQVVFDTSANISVKPALSYIKSGQKEISDYVSDVAEPRLSEYAQTAQNQMQNCVDAVQKFADDIVDKGFVKTADLQNALEGKQNVISDLPTIRNGATLGATALQPSALNGYATENWVGQQGYITGITSGDVTTALGYTPYNASNPSGYITSSALNEYATKNYVDTSKADIDLSNITSTGKNIANWSTNVSNCITEIPQDIKLELNNGTVTLKAGSKVYVPNGFNGTTPEFDVVTIKSDVTSSGVAFTGDCFYFVGNNALHVRAINQCSTFTTPPTQPISGIYEGYCSSDNKMYVFNANTQTWVISGKSFPICLVTLNSSTPYIRSLNQVFNGFGYIGSTIFALPGVKGLIPNGRNADGSLKNIGFTTSSVLTTTFADTYTADAVIAINGTLYSALRDTLYKYDEENNINLQQGVKINWTIGGLLSVTNGKITSFTPKTAFHAADYNDVVLKQDLATVHCVVETYVNGSSWYRVYDDGWCEQGGETTIQAQRANTGLSTTVTFLKSYKDTNYYVAPITYITDGGSTAGLRNNHTDRNTTFMSISTWSTTTITSSYKVAWYTCGYIL